MKNKLLALTLALLMLVTAFPAGAIGMVGVENAYEVGAIEQTVQADVMAVKTTGDYAPGINFFTGTTKVETFDDFTVTEEYAADAFPVDTSSLFKSFTGSQQMRITADASSNKYAEVRATVTSQWGIIGLSADASDNLFRRPAYFYGNFKHENNASTNFTFHQSQDPNNLQTPNNNTDTNYYLFMTDGTSDSTTGWVTAEISREDRFFGIDTWKSNTENIFKMGARVPNDTYPAERSVFYDNLAFVPYYKVTYKNIDIEGVSLGDDINKYFLGSTSDISVSADGTITGLPTAYPVDTTVTLASSDTHNVIGWATEQGATGKEDFVDLNNADIVLYPVWAEKEDPKTYSFVTSSGNYFDYTVEVVPTDFVFPTAAELGIAYEPKFNDGVSYYYPREGYKGEANEFAVSESYVIFSEDFDDEAVNSAAANLTPDYVRSSIMTSGFAKGPVDEHDGSKKHYNDIRNSWTDGELILADTTIRTPGLYTVKYDMNLLYHPDFKGVIYSYIMLGDTTDTSISSPAFNATTNKTVVLNLELYYNEDGKLAYKNASGVEKTFTYNNWDKLFMTFNVTGVNTDLPYQAIMYIDNLTIEYSPSDAPTNTKLASYRAPDEKLGEAGIRFAAYVTDDKKAKSTEYGWLVSRKIFLGDNYDNLFIDNVGDISHTATTYGINTAGVKFVAGAAYIQDVVDKKYTVSGDEFDASFAGIEATFFTGVVHGLKEANHDDVLVARPYIKIDGVYYYGECHETTYNEVYAKANS